MDAPPSLRPAPRAPARDAGHRHGAREHGLLR